MGREELDNGPVLSGPLKKAFGWILVSTDPLTPEFPMTCTHRHRNYLLEKPSIGPVDWESQLCGG